MHILLSSEETLYQLSTRTMLAKGRAEQVSAELFFKLKRSLPKKQFQEQAGYITTAAQAAFASLNKLDWTKEKLCGEVNLTPNTETSISFDRDSSSAGLGYALALALEWRKQLNKSIGYDVEVFATGEIHASGAVTEIGHLATKITAACHFMEGKNAAAQAIQTPENQVKQAFVIFYPMANQEDVTPELQTRVTALGGQLCPVERLQSALTILLGDAYDGDAEGRWEPFKGLLSFNYEDSLRFFGRERALSKLSQEYNEAEGLLVVTGVSGIGKSSLIKAGLIPQINQQMSEGNTLDWLVSTPKAHNSVESILFELLNTLDKHWSISNDTIDEKDTVLKALVNTAIESPTSLIDTIKKGQLSQPNKKVFYYIDQYEDIFNHQDISREQVQQLAPLLAKLAKQIPNLDIVISIRSEYEDTLGKYGSVSHVNPELNASEWGDIVYKQATSFGLRYEQGLEKRIVDEAASIQHALPALEYLLEQLYKKAKKTDKNARLLTHEHYEQLKGIKGVIASRAEEVVAKHPMQAHAFFEYFIGLNNENKPYAKSVNIDEVQRENEALYALIQAFIDAQLVVDCSTSTEKRVKLAHDTLFNFDNHDSAWTALKTWFTDNQKYLHWLNVISGDFKRWCALSSSNESSKADSKDNPSSAFLLNEHDLNLGLGFQQENSIQQPKVREYIAQSQQQKETLLKQKNKKQRLVILLVSALLLIAVGAGFIAYKKEELAVSRLNSLNSQIKDTLGVLWVNYLFNDLKDGKIEQHVRLNKLLKIIGSNDYNKIAKAVAALTEIMKLSGVPNELATEQNAKEIWDFNSVYPRVISRSGKYVTLELMASPQSYFLLWSDLELSSLSILLKTLLGKDSPNTLSRLTKGLSLSEKVKLNFIQKLAEFGSNTTVENLKELLKEPGYFSAFVNKESDDLIDLILSNYKSYYYYYMNMSSEELSDIEKERLRDSYILRISKLSEVLYSYSQGTHTVNQEKKKMIEDFYYSGLINLQSNTKFDEGTPYSHFNLAESYMRDSLFGDAIIKFDEVLKLQPKNFFSILAKIKIKILQGNLKEATFDINSVKDNYPEKTQIFRVYLTFIEFLKGETDLSVIPISGRYILEDLSFHLSHHYFNQKQYKRAADVLSETFKLKDFLYYFEQYDIENLQAQGPQNWSWYMLYTDNVSEVPAILTSVISVFPVNSENTVALHTNLAHAYLLSGDYDSAKAVYEKYKGYEFKDGNTWGNAIIADFKTLEKDGITHPGFARIAKEVFSQ